MIGWLLASTLSLAAEPRPRPPELDGGGIDAVEAYYERHGRGAILRSEVPAPQLRFSVSRHEPWRIDASDGWDPVRNQSLFTFDVERWLELEGEPDLLSAKRGYYAALAYDVDRQLHEQPFAYLEGWGALFHPPITELTLPADRYTDLYAGPAPDPTGHPYLDPDFQRELDEASGTVLTRGNELEYLPNGLAFDAKLDLVGDADRTLYGAVMYFGCGESSDLLAQALIDKAQQGVDVRLVIERVYRETFGRMCADELKAGGVKLLVVGDSMRLGSLGAVMHHKIWIADGEQMVLGGQNIVKDDNESTGFNHMNRDSDVWVRGPTVTDAQQRYLEVWRDYGGDGEVSDELARVETRRVAEAGEGLRGSQHYARWLHDPQLRTQGVCRVALQGLNNAVQPIAPLVARHLELAREQVVFTTPTLVWEDGDTEVARMFSMMREGPPGDPRIVVVTNGEGGGSGEVTGFMWRASLQFAETNKPLFAKLLAQSRHAMSRMTAAGTRRGAWQLQANPRFEAWTYVQYMHAKLWDFDRLAVMVSSWNLDVQSADLNHETALICMDDKLRRQLEHSFTLDLINSIPVTSSNGR